MNRRIIIIENVLAILFLIALVLDLINKYILRNYIPNEIIAYFFWFFIGLFIGFKICKLEFIKNEKE